MANAVYPKFKERMLGVMLTGAAAPGVFNVKAYLLTSAYTYSAAHEFASDLTGILTDGRSPAFANKSTTNGVFDADDVTLPTVTGSQTAASFVIVIDSGTDSTSRLVAYLDTGVTGLPFLTNGGDITITWDNGASRIMEFQG